MKEAKGLKLGDKVKVQFGFQVHTCEIKEILLDTEEKPHIAGNPMVLLEGYDKNLDITRLFLRRKKDCERAMKTNKACS